MAKKNLIRHVAFKTTLLKFASKGEKTGWTYIEVPIDIISKISPGSRKSFRVKGFIDAHPIKGAALLPMGDGNFILPVNAGMRKGVGKRSGAMVDLRLTLDTDKIKLNADLVLCLEEDPKAYENFKKFTFSHQHYFSKWIDGAKTDSTKANRIARVVSALLRNMNYGEMLREKSNKM